MQYWAQNSLMWLTLIHTTLTLTLTIHLYRNTYHTCRFRITRLFSSLSTEELLPVNIAYELTYSSISRLTHIHESRITSTSINHIYSVYYMYVSNVLINRLLFELSNYRKVQFTKWNSSNIPLNDWLTDWCERKEPKKKNQNDIKKKKKLWKIISQNPCTSNGTIRPILCLFCE